MAITLNGNGTITGISVGGLPDGVVDAGTLATNSVDSDELIDGSVDDSHLSIPSLGDNSHSKVVASTYDLSTASGNKDITGFGFNPKVIIAFWGESQSVNWGWGFMQLTQGTGYGIRNIGASTTGVVDQEGNLLAHKTNSSGGVGQVGTMTSITDGVRIAFTKTGSPTGTLYIKLIGFL